jgi:uncharacterized membrane protein
MKLRAPKVLREVGWRTVVGAVLLGGIIHILAVFAVPVLGSGNAFLALRDKLPLNRMVMLPPATPGAQLLPFMAPGTLYAICRYDLTEGPVTVTAALAEAGWALSLHTPQGDNFYVMPAQQLRRPEVSLLVVPGGERAPEFIPAAQRVGAQGSQIAAPAIEGLIVVRAPLRGLAWRAETEALLSRSSCTQVKR